jgi:hypothetical protein
LEGWYATESDSIVRKDKKGLKGRIEMIEMIERKFAKGKAIS